MRTLFLVIIFLLYSAHNAFAETYELKTVEKDGMGHGNAVAISKNELLTNWHLTYKKEIIIIYVDGKPYTATILKTDEQYDISLIKIEKDILIPYELAKTSDIPTEMIGFRYSEVSVNVSGNQYFEVHSTLEKNSAEFINKTHVLIKNKFQIGFSGSAIVTKENKLYGLISSGFRIHEGDEKSIWLKPEAKIVTLIHILDFLGKI